VFPDYLTHYYRDAPFRTLTELPPDEVDRLLAAAGKVRKLPRRLRSAYYFQERRKFEALMHRQFVAKGGRPDRENPHYMILGNSEFWEQKEPHVLTIPLAHFPTEWISFTYSDSWVTYVDRDLRGNAIPRKQQYGTLYRLAELPGLFETYGWPGDRWKSEAGWEHDVYVEAQIWCDEPLREYLDAGA
jgi:hypothetical protein